MSKCAVECFFSIAGDGCEQRSFGENLIVCVCNSTYCDTITEQKPQQNQYLWYTSTEDGKRMELSVHNFSAKNEPENDIVFLVDSSQKFQTIQGFGGAMTDAAALNIRSLSNETQRMLLEYVFGIIFKRATTY